MPDTRLTWHDPVPLARASARVGIDRAGEYLLGRVKPRTPHLGGDLEERTTWSPVEGDDVEQGGQIQSDTPYAVAQHEGHMTYTTKDGATVEWRAQKYTKEPNPEAGPKFVEGPLAENRDVLLGIIGGAIAAGFR